MRFGYTVYCLLLAAFLVFYVSLADSDDFDDVDDVEDGTIDDEEDTPIAVKEKIVYERPLLQSQPHFHEPFDTRAEFLKRWIPSQAKKDGEEEDLAKYDGKWVVEEPRENPILRDLGLVLKSKAKHHAISVKLDRPFEFTKTQFIAQYEVKFQNGMDCGGAYVKLLSKDDNLNLKMVTDKTPYTIMFGPDKCGNDHKLHFIFRHKNPVTGEFEEKHAKKPTAKLDSYFTDRNTHLYTLTVREDNSYEIKVDDEVISSGNLLNDVSPPVNPPEEIEDPDSKKPLDWDDREKIPDPDATKPEDWDETEPATILDTEAEMPVGWLEDEELYIPDPSAKKPDDWDDEIDSEWEPPRIDNPKCLDAPGCGKWERPTIANPLYKGIWKAPMIENPEYKGVWKPNRIPNPHYFEDTQPFRMTTIGALALELWSMTDDIMFDNFIISDNESLVQEFTAQTWALKKNQEQAASSTGGLWQTIKGSADERPWLWAVYVMVLLLPVVMLSICLCPKSGPVKPEDIVEHKKKFDEPTPDTIEEEEEEEAEAKEGEEKEEEGKESGDGDGEAVERPVETLEAGAAGDGSDQVEGEEDAKATGSPQKTNSPRKRKTRKE